MWEIFCLFLILFLIGAWGLWRGYKKNDDDLIVVGYILIVVGAIGMVVMCPCPDPPESSENLLKLLCERGIREVALKLGLP